MKCLLKLRHAARDQKTFIWKTTLNNNPQLIIFKANDKDDFHV
jgi:hypothetical protein